MRTITINSSANQVKKTLGVMGKFQNSYKADPDFVELARNVVRMGGARTPEEETEAVRRWVKSFIDYRQDPDGVEYLQDPIYLLTVSRCGDCDDMAMLAATLLSCVGHECYPVGVVWEGQRQASHAVCWDSTAERICDPVADVSVNSWPGPGQIVREYVMGIRV
jgi:hypothetical protein